MRDQAAWTADRSSHLLTYAPHVLIGPELQSLRGRVGIDLTTLTMPKEDVIVTTISDVVDHDVELSHRAVDISNAPCGHATAAMEKKGTTISTEGLAQSLNSSDEECSQSYTPGQEFNYEKWLAERFHDPARCRRFDIGVAFQNLNVYGFGKPTDYQKTIGNYVFVVASGLRQLFGQQRKLRIEILRDFEGLVRNGEMLMVLGKPGSGCTTFLKTLAGQTHGFFVDSGSRLNYQGMHKSMGAERWSNEH